MQRVAWIIGLLVFVTSTAGAQAEEPQGYRDAVNRALSETQAGNWPEARALFEQAHALFPNARTLRGLGVVAYEGRRYVAAREYLSAALEHDVRPLTETQRKEVEKLLAMSESFVARFEVELDPSDAELWVDGDRARRDAEGLVLLDPGEHELVLRATGRPEVVRRLAVTGGQRGALQLRAPEERPAVVDGPKPVAPKPAEPRIWTWVAAGGAVVLGGTALVLYLSGQSEASDIEDACARMPGGFCTEDEKRARLDDSGIATKETLSTVGLLLSGAAAIGAGVLFFVEQPSERQAGVALRVSPAGAALSGRF